MLLKTLVAIKLLLTHPKICLGGGSSADLLPLEKKLILELTTRLDEINAQILISQLEEVNLIERVHTPKTVITFNCINGLVYSLKRKQKFKEDKQESVLSRIDFELGDKKYRAIFYIVYGNFFSIEFTSNMSTLLVKDNISILD